MNAKIRMLTILARGLAEGATVRLEAGDRWSWTPATRTLTFRADDVEQLDLPVCLALVAHEIGHAAITAYHRPELPAAPMGLPTPLWLQLLNAVEDPRVERWMMGAFAGIEPWFAALFACERAQGRLGDVVSWCQRWMLANTLEWGAGWRPADIEGDRVRAALEETRADRRAYAETAPPAGAMPLVERARLAEISAQQALPHAYAAAEAVGRLRGAQVELVARAIASDKRFRRKAANCGDCDVPLASRLVAAAESYADETATAPGADALQLAESLLDIVEGVPSAAGRRPAMPAVVRADLAEADARAAQAAGRPCEEAESSGCGATFPWRRTRTPSLVALQVNREQALEFLRSELDRVFPKARPGKWQTGYSSGRRIDLRKAVQLQADPKLHRQLWQRRAAPTKPDAAALLLVDLSGSMAGCGKIEAAVLAASVCAQSLRELDIPCAVYGFQDQLIPFAAFGEAWSPALAARLAEMRLEASGTRPAGHNHCGCNDDGPCLAEAAAILATRRERTRTLIVISDGQPAGSRSTAEDLTKVIAELERVPGLALAAIGIGPDTDHVAEFYPDAQGSVPVANFPVVLARSLARRLNGSVNTQVRRPVARESPKRTLPEFLEQFEQAASDFCGLHARTS